MTSTFRKGAAILAAAAALHAPAAQACTSFLLKTAEHGFVYGRTLEFALPLHSKLMAIPRQFAMRATGPDGKAGTGLAYASKYAAVGANGLDLPLLVDGMNEKGLSGGLLFFPGYAGFQQVSAAEATSSIASFELLTYILTQFATVDEVKAGLPKIKVNQAPQEVFGMAVPVHATIHDANGKSIVIEYIGGQLQITDNPTSVMTNAPQISWHFTNIGQYANVTADPGASVTVGGKVFNPASSGTGMNGLPGDMSSPSRFLRAVFYKANAPVSPDAASAVDAAFHILNNFDIPPGAVRTSAESAAGGGISGYETTEWTAVADLKNKVYYLKTYGNQQVRSLPMSGLDLDAKAVSYFPLDQKPFVIDVTKP